MFPILYGFAQIGFQRNVVSGLLFILAIALNSWSMLLAAVSAVFIAYYTAKKLGAGQSDLENGLYGYNAALLAIALVSNLAFTDLPILDWVLMLLLVPLGAALTSVLMLAVLRGDRFPAYSCPFILSAWSMLLLACLMGGELQRAEIVSQELNLFSAVLNGIGQVAFQASPISGVLILLALACGSLAFAGWTLFAAFTSVISASVLGLDSGLINSGFFGFNAILATLVVVNRMQCRFWPLLSVVLVVSLATVVLSAGFLHLGLIVFTTPFVLVVYLLGIMTQWRLAGM